MTLCKKLCRPLVLVVLLLGVGGCAVNQITGQEEPMFMSVPDEMALGSRMAPEIERALNGPIPDETLQRYVDRVGQKIAGVSQRPDWEYRYVAVEDTMINALALPGGHIYITRGLLEKLTSEAQLAGVLAHETAHVVARDSAVAMSKEMGLNALMIAAAAAGRGEAAQMVSVTGYFMMLRYSREDEQEADEAGMDYMVAAGYSPKAMVETMQMFQELDKVQPIEFLSTHPSPDNRIRYLGERVAAKYPETGSLKVGQDEFKTAMLYYLKTRPKPRKRREPEGL
jgi:beta-barrel assembly-enhancing protease